MPDTLDRVDCADAIVEEGMTNTSMDRETKVHLAAIGEQIADELGETRAVVRSKLRKMVYVLGPERVRACADEALRVQAPTVPRLAVFHRIVQVQCTEDEIIRFWPQTVPMSLTNRIATQLGEHEKAPRYRIWRLLDRLGEERVQAFVEQALTIEATGGMLLPDGSRRRTLGGVFFRLIKDSLSEDELRAVGLWRDWETSKANRPQPAPDPFDAGDQAWLQDILRNAGKVQTMDLMLVGTPGKQIEQGNLVIVAMKRTQQLTPPRGLPPLPAGHGQYLVFVTRKQWQRLGEVTPDTTLAVKGYATLHPKFSRGIVVYAESITRHDKAAAKPAVARTQRPPVPA